MTSPRAGSIIASAEAGAGPVRPRLILGSASARRLELLAQIGVTPDEVRAADIDETPRKGEAARDYVRRIAREKSLALDLAPDDLLLTADTTVTLGRRILGKPETEAEAAAFLRLLSGKRHRVLTAVALRRESRMSERLVESQVKFRALTAAEIAAYIASGEWRGKAGGYALQGRAAAFIPWLAGSPSAIIGLPLSETAVLLRSFGYQPETAS